MAGEVKSGSRSRRLATLLGAVAVLSYSGWMAAPYLRSIVVRDAAVTSWIYLASAPIDGVVDNRPLQPGQRVGSDGRITTILNERVDSTAADTAIARLTEAEARVASLRQMEADLRAMIEDRERQVAAYARVFKDDLQAEIATATAELAALDRQLALENQLAQRMAKLARSGSASQSDADEAAVRVAELERDRTLRERTIRQASLRLDAADSGIFLLDDGDDPSWALRDLDPLRIELLKLQNEEISAQSLLQVAQAKLQGIHQYYEDLTAAAVQAPPGVMIWSLVVGPGTTVAAGSPVASWLDCGAMLVDVPASDAEIALLQVGDAATVLLEGETEQRPGRVLLTRGAAATLGLIDLAALAKGRSTGLGQVLVELTPTSRDKALCPMGRAAYVDFPDVGLLDILRVRLRL